MASFLEFTANGARTYPIHALDYLATTHLAAKVNGTPVSAVFDDAQKLVTFASAPLSGATIRIERLTPRRREERLTQFLNLSTGSAGLTAALLDQDYRQNMLILGEGRDIADALAPAESGMMLGGMGQWAALDLRGENLAPGSNLTDAIIKSQLDTLAAGARNLPLVSGADNDDGLFVTAGEWDKRTPTQARTHLGLGTAAVLNVGTGANNVAQFDASAPPRYPTADGQNIDLTNHAIQLEIAKRSLATVIRPLVNAESGNGLDPTVATWSQNTLSRIDLSNPSWTGRTELNNSSDLTQQLALSSGTWRVRYMVRIASSAVTNWSFRITDDNDTSGQTIFFDLGVVRLHRVVSAPQLYYYVYQDELIFKSASAWSLCFRHAHPASGGAEDVRLQLYFHKISSSSA